MKELKFWNSITNRVGRIWVDKLICKKCGKEIKGKKFRKPERSFDFYHTKCYEEPSFNFICIDEAQEVTDKDFDILNQSIEGIR